ncbi:SGNH/GDSL hydrolase family protein, partial [Rhodococcus sp. NPDC058514]
VIGTLPSVHDCDAYGKVHSGRPGAVSALEAWGAEKNVPLVDLADAVRENVFSEHGNPDGIHWGWEGHERVAAAMLSTIRAAHPDLNAVEGIR